MLSLNFDIEDVAADIAALGMRVKSCLFRARRDVLACAGCSLARVCAEVKGAGETVDGGAESQVNAHRAIQGEFVFEKNK